MHCTQLIYFTQELLNYDLRSPSDQEYNEFIREVTSECGITTVGQEECDVTGFCLIEVTFIAVTLTAGLIVHSECLSKY